MALGAPDPGEAVQTLVQLGRLDEALARAQRWTEQQPCPPSLTTLSHVHRLRGETAEALDVARRAAATGAGPGPPLLWIFAEAGAIGEVQAWWEARLKKSPRLKTGPLLLALLGQRREALKLYGVRKPPWGSPRYARGYFHNVRAELLAGNGDLEGVWREVEEQLRLGFAGASCYPSDLAWLGA
jgi:hypothetical protein